MVEKTASAEKLKWWVRTMMEIHACIGFNNAPGSWA